MTPTDSANQLAHVDQELEAAFTTRESLAEWLYANGWASPCDAQHSKLTRLWEAIAALRSKNEELMRERDKWEHEADAMRIGNGHLRDKLAAAQSERDEAKAALVTAKAEIERLDHAWEMAFRDAGVYKVTLDRAAASLDCEAHTVDLAVTQLRKERDEAKAEVDRLEDELGSGKADREYTRQKLTQLRESERANASEINRLRDALEDIVASLCPQSEAAPNGPQRHCYKVATAALAEHQPAARLADVFAKIHAQQPARTEEKP